MQKNRAQFHSYTLRTPQLKPGGVPIICAKLVLVLFLQDYGYEVVCSVDGKQTLDLVTREAFDLFLFDNWMPYLSGVELTLRIRQFNKSTPIFFYSGVATEEEQRSALEAGAQGYLVKPVGIEELVERIERLIEESNSSAS